MFHFGCLNKIYALHPYEEDYEMIIPKAKKVIYKSNIELFDYQKEAKDKAIKAKNGVIVMPARSRKDTNSITINCWIRYKNIMANTYKGFTKSKLFKSKKQFWRYKN